MHIPTHILSGWCLANCLPLSPRQRLGCMVAAVIPDLDGLGIVFGTESDAFQNYHHLLGHNLPFALFSCGLLALAGPRRAMSFVIYLAMFHVHLVMDYFGSGAGWRIYYLWPISRWNVVNFNGWDFYSWQNILAAAILLVWMVAIAAWKRRTPLEAIMPDLDRQLVNLISRRAAPGKS